MSGRYRDDQPYMIEIYEFVIGPLSGRQAVVSATQLTSIPATLPGGKRARLNVEVTRDAVLQVWLDGASVLSMPYQLSTGSLIDTGEHGHGFCGQAGDISVYGLKVGPRRG
jgi:hypothetical protein